ncbi:MAG: molybdenum cofactor guanylyltransferase [Dehalococcoidia bacterium]
MSITSIILAGGRSLRLGQNKALQAIDGKSLIQWVVDRLSILSTEIIIATAHGEEIPCSSTVKITTAADIYVGKGPLGGIHSGLTASSSPRSIVVSCDTPFVSVGLLEYMTQICPAFDIVVPRIQDKIEPLCALYSRKCLAPIQELLEQDERQIRKLFSMVKVKYVEEDEVNSFDPEHLSFFNINSQADLDRAREIAPTVSQLPGRRQVL